MKFTTLARMLGQAAAGTLILAVTFTLVEPALGTAATTVSTSFTISQSITSEISFSTTPTNVTMSPNIGGLTGGTATGGTQLVVATSDTLGYQMTINASSSLGMIGVASSSNYIASYVGTAGTTSPDYTYAVNSARGTAFGYTVAASTTSDVSQPFKNTGSICNAGSGANTVGSSLHCWIAATSTQYTIVNRTTVPPSSGATTTLFFQVQVNANPNPALPNDTYVATTTLTATAN